MDRFAYDIWGDLTGHTGTTSQPYQYVGQLGYYTHYQIPSFNLLELGVRFYDPEIGRFTGRDRVAQSALTAYSYANCDPCTSVDPQGLFCWHIMGDCIGTSCHGDPTCPRNRGTTWGICWHGFAKCMEKWGGLSAFLGCLGGLKGPCIACAIGVIIGCTIEGANPACYKAGGWICQRVFCGGYSIVGCLIGLGWGLLRQAAICAWTNRGACPPDRCL